MEKIKYYFEKFFEIPLPMELEFDGKLIPIRWGHFDAQPDMDPDEALLLASEVAAVNPVWAFNNQYKLIHTAAEGAYIIGFYEAPDNNWFYYVRVDSWRRILFRARYGGTYGDSDRDRIEFREFLPRYLEFEERLNGRVKELEIVENPHENYYTIALATGETYHRSSDEERRVEFNKRYGLIDNLDFEGTFGELFEALEEIPTQMHIPYDGETDPAD